MAEESRFDFCKQCGALARDGVCQSCGYQDPEIVKNQEQPSVSPQSPYVDGYSNYGAVPPAQPAKKGKTVLILCIIIAIVLAVIGVAFFVVSYMYSKHDARTTGKFEGEKRQQWVSDDSDEDEEDWSEDSDRTEEDFDLDEEEYGSGSWAGTTYSHDSFDVTEYNWNEEGQDPAYTYYTGPYNALKDDLSYQISFTEEFYLSEATSNVMLMVEYPQISSGLSDYSDYINAACYYEYEYFYDLFTEDFEPLMTSENDTFYCVVDSHVTYMDENILSIVFTEDISMSLQGDSFSAVALYCLNFDLTTGELLYNTEILNLDEAFAADFREREAIENNGGYLTEYTDQEILEMLQDEGYLILFYTPMGMEVGLNLDDIATYVMYEDYQKYLNTY